MLIYNLLIAFTIPERLSLFSPQFRYNNFLYLYPSADDKWEMIFVEMYNGNSLKEVRTGVKCFKMCYAK